MPYDAYLRTDHWFILSNKVKERDGKRCKLCNSKNQLTAHHRSYKNRGKRNEIEDLVNDLLVQKGIYQVSLYK